MQKGSVSDLIVGLKLSKDGYQVMRQGLHRAQHLIVGLSACLCLVAIVAWVRSFSVMDLFRLDGMGPAPTGMRTIGTDLVLRSGVLHIECYHSAFVAPGQTLMIESPKASWHWSAPARTFIPPGRHIVDNPTLLTFAGGHAPGLSTSAYSVPIPFIILLFAFFPGIWLVVTLRNSVNKINDRGFPVVSDSPDQCRP